MLCLELLQNIFQPPDVGADFSLFDHGGSLWQLHKADVEQSEKRHEACSVTCGRTIEFATNLLTKGRHRPIKSSHLNLNMQTTQQFVAMSGEQERGHRRTPRCIPTARYVIIFFPSQTRLWHLPAAQRRDGCEVPSPIPNEQ